jgi:hypothetical protein
MQQVLKEEDCSKNLLIFGLVEAYEDTSEAVDGVLELNQNMKQFGLE